MLKRFVQLAIPVVLLVIIFGKIENRIIYWSLFLLIFVLIYLFHIMEDVVSAKMIEKTLGTKEFWSIEAGYIVTQKNNAILQKGRLVVYEGQMMFYKRGKDIGGVSLLYSLPVDTIEGYTLEKVDEFHPGVRLATSNGDVCFTSSKIAKEEAAFRESLGWGDE